MTISAGGYDNRPLILCIEDEADLREDLVDELQEAGYAVISAADVPEALQHLQAAHPDLILCDVTMPGMDGYELLDIVRDTRPDLADTPFVFLTAQASPEQVVRGKRAGADDYLVKPVDFDLMLATIAARIQQVARIHQRFSHETQRLQQTLAGLHEQQTRQRFQQIAQAFDYVTTGIVLLDSQIRVQFANRAAGEMLGGEATLLAGQNFPVAHGRIASAFRLAFDSVIVAGATADDVVECVTLPSFDGKHQLLLMVCSLAYSHTLADSDPVVMVMACDPARRSLLPAHALAGLFQLTPTEAQVACAFAEGKRSEQIADQFGISVTTVAFHKRNLFQKTRTNRQADLIALLLTLSVFDV
ncbi:MAG: response regulator [Burkholderiaceae bacterium]|nr:response regulator [Burkholderiaceae bacterium]